MRLLLLPPLAAAAALTSIPRSWSPRERAAAERITSPAIAAHVRFLASDLLEGRGAGTRGSELAMAYVASEMERIGLRPAGDGGTWLQRFDLVGLTGQPVAPPTVKGPAGPPLVLHP